ncbi:MAG TPA: acyl-CoA dehydrogenase family protein [Mycobacteriales bacterium]|jgi:alkylation response protein AidB-like acyl-CoA dehydrogenase|nr:acyl-CoA dehydrogenase family protein [Mycobacteriales bacterium]
MDFAFSEEQDLLRAAARDYLGDRFPAERVIALADSEPGWDPATWRELADLGWLDADLGLLEHAVIAEETGNALLPAPWWSTLGLAWPLLDDQLRAAVGTGERSVTVAWAEPGGPVTLADAATTGATTAHANGSLTGHKVLVPDLTSVTDVVVVAADGLYAVDLAADPKVVVPRSTMDLTRRLGELHLDATPARRLDVPLDALATARRRALALLACESVGIAQRALDLVAAYTSERQQFGRVIGTYQGVSHRVANTFVALQLARSMAYWAAWAVSAEDPDADLAVAGAASAAGEGAVFACEQSIQGHGGIGFTWEHVLHRYYKRAQWNNGFEGTGRAHRAAIADRILA